MTSRNQGTTTPSNTTMFTAVTPAGNYRRTFFDMRSKQSALIANDSDDDEIMEDALEELVKLTWNIWAVSPLFGLDFRDEVKLKQYAKRLREKVAASLSQENVAYEAKFTPIKDLVCNPQDPPALKVLVHSKTDEKDDATCIYRGIFLSWGEGRETQPDKVILPILLSRGAQKVTRAVHLVLRRIFDCVITAMPASQDDLVWLSTVILNSMDTVEKPKGKQAAHREFILGYQIPGLPASDTIKVKFPIASMVKLWSKICPPQPSSTNPNEQIASTISLQQVEKFYKCIKIQMLDNASLDLGNCLLDEISLPSLTIKSNKMKAADIDAMYRVLWYFNENALIYSPMIISGANDEEEEEVEEEAEEEEEEEEEEDEED